MKAPQSMELQLDSEISSNMIKLPSTPQKNSSLFNLFINQGSPYEMMLVETPTKQPGKLIDELSVPFPAQEHGSIQQESIMMEQEEAQSMQQQQYIENIENVEPNIHRQPPKTSNNLVNPQKIQQDNESSSMKFKTPGRSQRSNQTLTTSKKKPCTCKKSNCLKKYCECFKSGEICNENCDCIGCKNNDPVKLKSNQTKSSVSVQIMCNCMKSNCMKGYCDCYAAGTGCSDLCNCLDCKNTSSMTSQFTYSRTSKREKKVHWKDLEYEMQEQQSQS